MNRRVIINADELGIDEPRTQGILEAHQRGIEIIPLQQCLGHLEYVFRWQRYRRFAEDRKYPGTLCLSCSLFKRIEQFVLVDLLPVQP